MLNRRILFVSLCAIIAGAGFALPAFSTPPGGGGSQATFRPAIPYGQSMLSDRNGDTLSASMRLSRPAIGYPCTWSGSRDFAQGETAYRTGRYADAIAQWKAAASKDCAIAAYKLGMLYYGGKSQVAADRSLGAAWLQVAAESKTANGRANYNEMSQLAVRTLTNPQRVEYTADYARLRVSLGLPASS